jgi:hypothetical protein
MLGIILSEQKQDYIKYRKLLFSLQMASSVYTASALFIGYLIVSLQAVDQKGEFNLSYSFDLR